MYSVVFIFIFVFILGMPVRVPSGLSLALSLCWWPCGWQCHGSPGKATGYSSERRRKKSKFPSSLCYSSPFTVIQLAMALYLSFTFQSLIFKISRNLNFYSVFSTARLASLTCFRPCASAPACGVLGRRMLWCKRVQANHKSCAVKPALRSIFDILYIYYLNFLKTKQMFW